MKTFKLQKNVRFMYAFQIRFICSIAEHTHNSDVSIECVTNGKTCDLDELYDEIRKRFSMKKLTREELSIGIFNVVKEVIEPSRLKVITKTAEKAHDYFEVEVSSEDF